MSSLPLRTTSPKHNDPDTALASLRDESAILSAQEVADYIGSTDPEYNKGIIRESIGRLLYDAGGSIVPAAEFAHRLDGLYSIVTTGHPVFGRTAEAAGAFARLVNHYASGASEGAQVLEDKLRHHLKATFKPPSIAEERDQSLVAIRNAHAAVQEVEKIAIALARENYPQEWKALTYSPSNIATWIPFDWDGRKDISGRDLLREFVYLQQLMLEEQLLPTFESLTKKLAERTLPTAEMVAASNRILNALEQVKNLHGAFLQSGNDTPSAQDLQAKLESSRPNRITHSAELISTLEGVLKNLPEDQEDLAMDIVHLISRLKTHGLSLAKPHFRINSGSVVSAISERLGVSIESNDKGLDSTTLRKVSAFINNAEPKSSVALADVEKATQTLARQMGVMRIIKDQLDSHCSHRFLVAETHNVSVLLGALGFAKTYGVDDVAEICPLFEDSEGLDHARSITEKLLRQPAFQSYLRLDRSDNYRDKPMFHAQMGYSDSGRFLGGSTSRAFVEKAKSQIVLGVSENAPKGTVLVFFDTHGEGVGRGNDPANLENRTHVIATRFLETLALQRGVTIQSEESFQGGDGFALLGTPEMALRIMAVNFDYRSARYAMPDANETPDPFYMREKSRDDVETFFSIARRAHEKIVIHLGYVDMIGLFKNFLPNTGSRPVKRDPSSGGQRALPRAIQHNGTLAQLGHLATLTYGIGQAIQDDPERFQTLLRESSEFRRRMDVVFRTVDISDPSILLGYIALYNPDFWYEKMDAAKIDAEKTRYRHVAELVKSSELYECMRDAARALQHEFDAIAKARETANLADDPLLDPAYTKHVQQKRTQMKDLHALRQKDLEQYLALLPGIPVFGEAEGKQELTRTLMRLEPGSLEALSQVFQKGVNGDSADYSHLHEGLINPLQNHRSRMTAASFVVFDHHCAVG